jgi:lipopolysaccharide biosynthesis glycosyltransferase
MATEIAPVHVAFALDKPFLGYTAIAAASAAVATPHLNIHVLHAGDLGRGADNLARLIEHHGATASFHSVDLAKLSGLPVSGHVSVATYYRLSIADLLPRQVSKVIYLDGDLIVRRSLDELYAFDASQTGIAAVPEPHENANERLGIPADADYFNAGVLVIDLDFWRQSALTERLYKIAAHEKARLQFWDQDLLALYLQGNFTPLPSHWNVHHRYFFGDKRLPWPHDEPAIVHFSGSGLKPPDYKVLHPYASEFWSYARQVSAFGFKIQDATSLKLWARRFRFWRKHRGNMNRSDKTYAA